MQAQFSSRRSLRYPKLMIPGPVDVQDAVIAAMANGVMPHYGAAWAALYTETTEILKSVFHTDGDVFLVPGSGMCGLEAAINSEFCPREKVLIVNNGYFGGRLLELARAHDLQYVEATGEWGRPVDPLVVEKLLREEPGLAGLIAVHHETSTGVLNPIRDLGLLARNAGIPFVVDAVSSLGGEELKMDEWGIDACVAAANKALESVPGVSIVAVGRTAWPRLQGKQSDSPGWYLNLRNWKHYLEEWGGWHPAPVTEPTPAVIALNAALEELVKEGPDSRLARYKATARSFRQRIAELGFATYVRDDEASSCISAVCRLPGMDVPSLVSFLLEEKNIQIAGGLGQTKGEIFRVGHMGKAGSAEYIDLFFEGLRAWM